MKKNKPSKKVAKKATVKKQPAKKVAPNKEPAKVKVKVLTFEPDEVLQLKEHIDALKDVIKSQKEVAIKLRKRIKTLGEQNTELKQKLASKKESSILGGVDTGLGVTILPTRVAAPASPFNDVIKIDPPVVSSPTVTPPTKVDVSPTVVWSKENPFAPVAPPTIQKGLLGNCCAVKY